ncbi:hemerythrin domain-containing protein [Streptomyces vinaceus]|uniref:hemerythrin domain-containing protein n=1 Tax=Streptomyces vinaceus TaxID=1960 RepID=UPI0035D71DCC
MTTSIPMTHDDLTYFLQAHGRFREDTGEFRRVLHSPDQISEERAIALVAYWDNVMELLEHHHTVEDDVIWPTLRTKTSAADASLTLLESQHDGLDSRAAQVRSALVMLAGAPGPADRERAAHAAEEFHREIGTHLDQEESSVIPVMLASFSKADWLAIEGSNMESIVEHGLLARMLPWVLDGMADTPVRAILDGMPAALVSEYRTSWYPTHQTMRRAALGPAEAS